MKVYSIALIEDNPADVMLLRMALDWVQFRYELRQIHNTHSVVESVLQPGIPDVIIADANLPGIGSEEIIVRLKESAPLKSVPVIVISGMADPRVVERLQEHGVEEYIVKPSNLDGWLKLGDHLKKTVEKYKR